MVHYFSTGPAINVVFIPYDLQHVCNRVSVTLDLTSGFEAIGTCVKLHVLQGSDLKHF